MKRLARSEFINLIFSGPPGSGKKTIMMGFLDAMYGKGIYNTKNITHKISNLEFMVKSSQYHTEIDIKRYKNHDKQIIMEYVKNMSKTYSIKKFSDGSMSSYNIVVLNNSENLSHSAQTAMRRLIEKYYKTTRFIMITSSLDKIIDPIRSRFYTVRVPAPPTSDIENILFHTCIQNSIQMSREDIHRIAEGSNKNIKMAILSLFVEKISGEQYLDNDISEIHKICKVITDFRENTSSIYEVKDMIYSLIIMDVNTTKIARISLEYFLKFVNGKEHLKPKLAEIVAYYDSNLINHCKDVIHLEAMYYNILSLLMIGSYNCA